jgi:vacuolar-type H+-ATPase subunit C/Vma6
MLLGRWCGPRREILRVVFEEDDLRSLRAVLRGAVAGISPELRIQGLIPTAALPLRALKQLAHLDLGGVSALLATWGSPYAGPVARQTHRMPDLFQLELDLTREFLERSAAAARGGERFLRRYTTLVVDLENLRSASVLASERHEQNSDQAFIAGGTRVTLPRYHKAATSAGFAEAVLLLAPHFHETALGRLLEQRFETPADLEDAILDLLVAESGSAARVEPLSSAPVLHYVLRLRSELRRLQRLIWKLALGGSPTAGPRGSERTE